MFRKHLFKGAIVLALLLGVLSFAAFPRSHVRAAPAPVTRGDVEAIFHAGFTAGQAALLVHASQALGAPVEDVSRAAIDFFTPGPTPHFCVDDWHLLRLTDANSVDGVLFFTSAQVVADLQQTTITFTMDFVSVSMMQTPITHLNAADQRLFGLPGPTFLFTTGSIFSPGALGVGTHRADFSIFDPAFGFFHSHQDLVVDASGTGACLQG
jgi:hypothetical protein